MIINNYHADNMLRFILMAIALVGSIILHELAHGYVALLNGDKTAKYAGRLSFNPARHFDMQGILMLLIIHVGYAKPVPVNPNNFRRRRLGFFTVSIAGIVVNIILSFIFTAFYVLMLAANHTSIWLICLTVLFGYIALYNLFLCFFNLLPLYPLDGYNILESIFSFKNPVIKFLRNYGTMMLVALFLLSIIVDFARFPSWLDLLGSYLRITSNFVYSVFARFWSWLFGL